MHVFRNSDLKFDYMVGAQVEGFETMVSLSEEAGFMILEGDEYLSSPDDLRPKFHLYKPHIALLSGIAWDHINVFPTFDNYVEQFRIFAGMIQAGGSLVWYQHDRELQGIASMLRSDIQNLPYSTHPYCIEEGKSCLLHGSEKVQVSVFGQHNMANLGGALEVCRLAGIRDEVFYKAIPTFSGAGKRLQKLGEKSERLKLPSML
jgi:UDP-N-acetylmuramate: L-alanyl-gamma-D-glutamyl-meso-diaminopimelate ligase